jgi:hypothetical protein
MVSPQPISPWGFELERRASSGTSLVHGPNRNFVGETIQGINRCGNSLCAEGLPGPPEIGR